MAKFKQADLVEAKYGIQYEVGGGSTRTVRIGTPGVIIKCLTGGQCLVYFHNYPVLLVGDMRNVRRR
jgi:hypothetical protein